jgi:hypothetical protein
MDKRLVLNKQQSEVVDRIKEIFGELQKEGVAIGVRFAQDHLERNILCLINAEEVSDIQSSWEFMVDQDDPRRSYAYIDDKGRYIEPEDEAFNADEIYYMPRSCDLEYIAIGNIYDNQTIVVYFK